MSEWSKPIEDFLNERTMKMRIEDIAANYSVEKSLGKSLLIDYQEIEKFNPQLADYLIKYPDEIFAVLNETATKIASTIKKTPINVRVRNLPKEYSTTVQQLGVIHLGILTQFECVVTLTSDRLAQMEQSTHMCNYCGKVVEKKRTKTSSMKMEDNCVCGHNSWTLIEAQCRYVDVQKAQCQELIERLNSPSQTPLMDLWFSDDLTNAIIPGEKVRVVGVLKTRAKERERNVFVRFIDVVSVDRLQQDVEDITFSEEEIKEIVEFSKNPKRDDILSASFAPHISGLGMVKTGLILQQLGGTAAINNEIKREQLNVLLIGDPGMAKSELARFNMTVAPKAIRTSGGGTSGCGVTASMEKSSEYGGWVVKAGAAVLANNGICEIDEFDKMDAVDQGLIHEVMSDQRVSIAKAGKTLNFPAKTAILAICNPKFGRFDQNLLPVDQFNISEALRQRFDLIFVLIDKTTKEQDVETVEHINRAFMNENDPLEKTILSPEKIKKYIAYAKRYFRPTLKNVDAMKSAQTWFVELRDKCKQKGRPPLPYRFYESLLRLAGAYARRRLSNDVEKEDVDSAQLLLEYSIKQYLLDESGVLDANLADVGKTTTVGDRLRLVGTTAKELCGKTPITEYDLKKKVLEQTGIEPGEYDVVFEYLRGDGSLKKVANGLLVYKELK